MRGTVAKQIRRKVYGDRSIRDRSWVVGPKGECRCGGLRASYKTVKRLYREGK